MAYGTVNFWLLGSQTAHFKQSIGCYKVVFVRVVASGSVSP
jgi:hypothetical protein